MDFKRAHSEEQRAQRRRQILDVGAAMLTEMPVAKVTLNELSRRVGLAKSNVLRYFESREAVLLDLLDAETRQWLAELEQLLQPAEGTARERGDQLAAVVAGSLARRPVWCDLNSAQASVLDHNVTVEVAIKYKRASRETIESMAALFLRYLPELGTQDAFRLVATTLLLASAAWPYSNPPQAMLDAYAADPSVAAMRTDFTDLLTRSLAVTITGLLVRHDDAPVGAVALSPAHPSVS
ncbi:TetR family transcriptional regulator [Actinoplanes sp. LDG1-06]|uniref:TetR family transcriptional regulator n=1 Tax=Paractinoplanes ovalisporus TaxID=2810368 RepID=A0ABS2AJ12_9ACTN|nr:TetR family transcriptional regulator [Actinoplanes ovalisporus]MBM2619830.1 TetR family transcriptional regulator [Actinoplanes ovalisporus]